MTVGWRVPVAWGATRTLWASRYQHHPCLAVLKCSASLLPVLSYGVQGRAGVGVTLWQTPPTGDPACPSVGVLGLRPASGLETGQGVTTFHGGLPVTPPWLLLLGRPSRPREHSVLSTTTSGASGPWPSSSPAAHGSCTHLPPTTRRHHPRHPPSCDSLSRWQQGPREPGQPASPRSGRLRPPGLTPVPRPRARSQQLGTGLTFPPPHRQAPNPSTSLEPAPLLPPVPLCEAHSGSGGLPLPNSTTPAP